ncbi:MAG TPA: hypothetical protein VMT22_14645 [Terriglobales bacterium]|jgi:hypothetical protein|nr:hypothetical protein [Terriglobales bacterium]
MTSRPDALTVALTGQLFFILVIAAILALLTSWAILRRYRRAVVKSMQRRTQSQIAEPTGYIPPAELPKAPDSSLSYRFISAESLHLKGAPNDSLYRQAKWRSYIGALIYIIAGVGFAMVMTAAFLRSSHLEFLPFRFLYLTWTHCWPVVLTVTMVSIVTRRARNILVLGYFALGAALSTAFLDNSPNLTIGQLIYLWFENNAIPWFLLLLFLNRRIRAVGPLVMVFMLISVAGATLFVSIAGANLKFLRAISDFTYSIGVGPVATIWAMHLLGFVAFAAVGWLILGSLRQLYQRKQLSERSIKVDAIWLLFGIVNSMGLVFQGPRWIFSGGVAFAVYKVICFGGFRILQAFSGDRIPAPRLLLLRVFALGKRSELVYDPLGKYWLNIGSIQMIAGPDLAASTIEPHEFLDFLSGNLSRRFIDSGATLDLRMAQMDLAPDGDGRYRVTEFFCHDDTWKLTLARLVDESDAVLMDLRGFSPNNRGCVFEITELFNLVSLSRLVFVIDATTDQTFLRQTMQQAWRQLKERSPNRRPDSNIASLIQISRGSAIGDLLRAISAAVRT